MGNKTNLCVRPKSQQECNQLASIVHTHNKRLDNPNDPPFRVGVLAWFWDYDNSYTTTYMGTLQHIGELLTPNQLAARLQEL